MRLQWNGWPEDLLGEMGVGNIQPLLHGQWSSMKLVRKSFLK